MEQNSLFLAFIFIVSNIITICVFLKHKDKIKKDTAHYEAISDEHIRKMYNPISVCIGNIFLLIIGGFILSNKELAITYFVIIILQKIQTSLIIIMANIDALAIKQGLIAMFANYNAYTGMNKKIKTVDEPSGERTHIYYYIDDIYVYHESISTKNITQEEKENNIRWFEKRFNDYIKYIPKDVLKQDNIDEVDNYFTYLDDVRNNF